MRARSSPAPPARRRRRRRRSRRRGSRSARRPPRSPAWSPSARGKAHRSRACTDLYTEAVGVVSFARGAPAPECLPVSELADCSRAAVERDGTAVLSYGSGGGYAPLREWIAARHGVEASRVVVTSGSLQGFVFLCEQLVQPGSRVLVEAPTYDRPLKILGRLGAEIVGLPMDDDGLQVDALEQALATGDKPAFLYTIATFQNPSGRTLAPERRARIAALAREHELLVLEDDPY